jgi:hypothetical protein
MNTQPAHAQPAPVQPAAARRAPGRVLVTGAAQPVRADPAP